MSSDEAVYGKSYWEIVVQAFRRNLGARIALWIAGGMIAVAILGPLIANDRPYSFHGTMPGEYRKGFTQLTRGAYMSLLSLPNRLKEERERFLRNEPSLNELLRRATDAEATAFYETLTRLRKRAESIPEIRGRWISRDVTLAEMLAEMTPAEKPPFEAARDRIARDLQVAYQVRLDETLSGIARKLRELGDQTGAAKTARAAEIAAAFRAAAGPGFLEGTEDRRPLFQAALDSLKADFDPAQAQLLPKRRWPLFDSLHFLDIFFITALALAVLAFGPLTRWSRLGKLAPLQRRWLVTWGLIVTPAAVLSLCWLAFHDVKFETLSYKTGVAEKSVVMDSSLWPPIAYRYDEVPEDASLRLRAPGSDHLFGTDFIGRDLLSRMIWGSRISLSIGFVAMFIALTIGITLGALAGYFRGGIDIVISRVIEIMLCFPIFFLILAVVVFLPPSIYYVMLVLGLFGWMGISRLQRGEFLRLVNLDFVAAARALGATQGRIMFRHLLPNALGPVLVAASFSVASAMLTESALSFLGFGVQDPETSWGQILFSARAQVSSGTGAWWTFTIPGFAIFVAVTCYNLVGDGIRDAIDPRLKS